jgi:hypothetical protein
MNERKKRVLRRALITLAALILFLVGLFLSLPLLFAPPDVAPADVIMHLAIEARLHGDEYVARLYAEGVARKVICASSQASWEVYPADYARAHLIELGVRADDISVLHFPITDCGGEVMPVLISRLKEQGAKSVLLVVDPTVTRFGRWRTRSRFQEAGINAVTFAAEDRRAMLDRWWRTHWKAQRIVLTLMNSSLDLLYAPCR